VHPCLRENIFLILGKCTTSNYKKSDGSLACGFFVEDGLTQDVANTTCRDLGARLPEIYSSAENEIITSFLVKKTL